MVRRSPSPKALARGLLAVILISSAGCMGFFGSSGTNDGELLIFNEDSQSHEVVIQGVGNGEITQSIAANSSQSIALVESPGRYAVNATIDGMTRVNTTVEYNPGGENGEQLAGPGLILTIQPDGEAFFSRSYD